MKPENHIKRLLRDTNQIQEHGHCKKNAAAFVAVSDIDIAVEELRKALGIPKSQIENRK